MKNTDKIVGNKGSTKNKVRKLQKQYNTILVDLFDRYAAECIEAALESNQGSFGENMSGIIQNALDELKMKVMSELDINDEGGVEVAGIEIEMGNEPKGFELEYDKGDEYDDSGDTDSFEDEMTETSEEEDAESDEEQEEEEKGVEESFKYFDSSMKRDGQISKSRRGDQTLLSEAYDSIFKKR